MSKGASPVGDRATRASTEPASGLGHSAGIPSAVECAIHAFVQDYCFEFEDGRTYTPTAAERAMLEDAIHAWEGRPF